MNPQVFHNNRLMFWEKAVKTQYNRLLTVMADAVSECRTAENMASQLSTWGKIGLLRLIEIWSGIKNTPDGTVFQGTATKILADVLAQIYAHLTLHSFQSPADMAIGMELLCMMDALMQGEWFE